MTPEVLKHLTECGVEDDTELSLEFFFYSNTVEKVKGLSSELEKLNYEVEYRESAAPNKLFISTGWTTKMKVDTDTVRIWVAEMCRLGYNFDCEFDGWGTTPDQD